MIEVQDPGRLVTVQDQGRPGYERYGVPPGGAADWFSAAVANRLVGNDPAAALLEFTDVGPTLMFHEDTTIAVTGDQVLDAVRPIAWESWRMHRIQAPMMIGLRRLGRSLRGYLAVQGGIDVPVVLGSRSLCPRGGFGGGFGRPLHTGDVLPIGSMSRGRPWSGAWPIGHRLPPWDPWQIRVIAGPHVDAFPSRALGRLTATACQVTPAIDRMGLRITTPGLHLQAEEILTTPVTVGAVQVTPSGELIALLVDHPTTGGYPVIATVIWADIPLLAQARPGDTIRFTEVDGPEAARALRRMTDWLELQ